MSARRDERFGKESKDDFCRVEYDNSGLGAGDDEAWRCLSGSTLSLSNSDGQEDIPSVGLLFHGRSIVRGI